MTATPDQFSNFGNSRVAYGAGGPGTALQPGDTSVTLTTGDGNAKFPSTAPFMVSFTLNQQVELAKCTARSGDTLTLARGQEGTAAQTWFAGSVVQLVVSAGSLADLWTAINRGRMYNVLDYGAKGDGVTDDTAACQAAINAAQAAGGGAVLFPANTYLASTPLTISASNITLLGVGKSSILQPAAGFVGAAVIYTTGGIQRLTVKDLYIKGASGTYSSNPACDGIQLNSDCQDTTLQGLRFNALNGWAVQLIAGASGTIGYAVVSDCVARVCKAGYHFQSTQDATNWSGGVVMTNTVADNCQNGDAFFFDQITDSVMDNCQGYCQQGVSLHIKGSAFLFVKNCDLGGAAPTTPCVLIEKGASHSNDHIVLDTVFIQKGTPGLKMVGVSHTRIDNCDVYFNQTHGIELDDDATNGPVTISNCHFYQNNRNSAATTYDLENLSQHGKLIVRDCLFETGVGGGANQVAASIDTPNFWAGFDCQNNWFAGGSPALTNYRKTVVRNNQGFNPLGHGATQYVLPVSSTSQFNDSGVDCMVYVTGASVAAVLLGGVSTGTTSGWFRVPVAQTITVNYTGTPTWSWFGD